MRRWIAALAAEQIGNNQALFQDPALWYWNGFHRCKANITLRLSPMVLLTASRVSELLPDAQLYLFGGLVREHSVAPVMGTAA